MNWRTIYTTDEWYYSKKKPAKHDGSAWLIEQYNALLSYFRSTPVVQHVKMCAREAYNNDILVAAM